MRIHEKRWQKNSRFGIQVTIGVVCGLIVLIFLIVLLTQTGKPKIQKTTGSAAFNVQVATANQIAGTEAPTEAPTEAGQISITGAPSAAADLVELTGANLTSQHAVLLDVDQNTILAQRDPEGKIYPASMTKVMTLLVAVENIDDLNDTFTMTNSIIDPLIAAEASRAGFEDGETVTITDLLYGIVLPSGADATTAIAQYVSGTEDAYVELMNQKAQELGLEHTHFVNTSGLHDENHYSTALDIAKLMEYAMQNDTCREILSTQNYTTSKTSQHPDGIPLESTMFSRMYGTEVDGITILAGKTGYTDEAGNCLVSYAKDDEGKTFVAVTAKGTTYKRAIYDTFALYGIIHDGYPMPTDLDAVVTDANGNAVEADSETTTTTASIS